MKKTLGILAVLAVLTVVCVGASAATEYASWSEWDTAHDCVTQDSDGAYVIGGDDNAKAVAAFKDFRDTVNAGVSTANVTFKLGTDIDLSGETWTSIGSGSNSFNGIFDGVGHKITYVIKKPNGDGKIGDEILFGGVVGNNDMNRACVRNLILDVRAELNGKCDITSTNRLAGLAVHTKYAEII